MTLQERLRQHRVILKSGDYDGAQLMAAWCEMVNAADALDALTARNKELEGALRELMRVDEIGRDPNTNAESWRPLKRAAWDRAREVLK